MGTSEESREFELNIPRITPQEMAEWMREKPQLVLLDVREEFEIPRASIPDERVQVLPLSVLAQHREEALPVELNDPDRPVVVFCHVGIRSDQVVFWLRSLGRQEVYSLQGGIDAYALLVDPTIRRY